MIIMLVVFLFIRFFLDDTNIPYKYPQFFRIFSELLKSINLLSKINNLIGFKFFALCL